MTQPQKRVQIQWTTTALECLRRLPKQAQRGLSKKIDQLYDCKDIRQSYKPLSGPLQGFYRVRFSRYRAVFCVEEDQVSNGDVLITIKIKFLVVGKREERSRDDVYRVAKELVERGVIEIEELEREKSGEEETKHQRET